MSGGSVLRGVSTISFFAGDLEAAAEWYSDFLGIDPYFSVQGYVEFRLGDYQQELGIVDSRYVPSQGTESPAGAIVYWHVDDIERTYERLIELGARSHAPIKDRANGFRTASVVDPFGNVLGIMHNPHYIQMLEHTDANG